MIRRIESCEIPFVICGPFTYSYYELRPRLINLILSFASKELDGKTADTHTEASAIPAFVEFSQKMVENLFNYTSSFAVSSSDLTMRARPSENYVPFSVMQQWYSNFERRLQQNPYFWKTL